MDQIHTWQPPKSPVSKQHAPPSPNFKNEKKIRSSSICGCYYCLRTFPPDQLQEEDWYPERDGQLTAWCPYCGIDSVIGDASGIIITDRTLREMKLDKFGWL